MFRSNLARACALTAVLVAPAACSDGDGGTTGASATVPATTATGAAPPASTATTAPEPMRLIEVTYAGGQVAGGAQRASVRRGELVRIRVTSDVADEVHVHTYDVRAAVAPGQPAQLDLVASIPGRHEVELEAKHRQLLVLEVR